MSTFISGYTQLKKFTVEVPQPPSIKLPESVQSFTILNRSLGPEFRNYDNKDLQIEFYKKNFEVNTLLLDSMVSDSTILSLGDYLFDSQRFDVVIPVDRAFPRNLSYNKTPDPLDWSYVEEVCSLYKTDASIVLENMAVRVVTNYETGYEANSLNLSRYHYASMDFYTRAHWRIYNPKSKKIIVDYIMSQDTIFWDNLEYDIADLFKGLPSVKEAAIASGIRLAYNFSEKIAPVWVPATRYYYVIKNDEIDKSIGLAADGDWAGALENWLKYSNYGKSSVQSKIMMNIALGYEMNGDIEKAMEWAKASLNISYREITNHYLKELIKRYNLLKE